MNISVLVLIQNTEYTKISPSSKTHSTLQAITNYLISHMITIDAVDGVMVNMLAFSAVDRWFKPISSKTKRLQNRYLLLLR